MSAYRKNFPGQHTFLPVVHVEATEQALRNAKIAADNGADGVFLINHHLLYLDLIEIYQIVRAALPGFWIGLNCLDLGRSAIDHILPETDGLWVDDAGITEGEKPTAVASEFVNRRRIRGWPGLYFGGVAFKYQKEIKDVATAARLACSYMDVVTTSGAGTGEAADVEKISLMKEAMGDHPLAIASGTTPKNVQEYMPYADCFLVATGISDSHTELNPKLVRAFADELVK